MSLAQPTFDDVRKLFQESSREMREMREQARLASEQARQRSEQERLERLEMFEKDRRERLERSLEIDKKIKQVNESIGRLGNKLGDFVEEMVRPAAVRLFRECGIDVHEVHQNVSANRNGEGIEVDLLVVNDGDVIAIECKSSLSIDDINGHLKRLEKLKRLLPTYANKRVMGAVTGMVIPDNVAQYAYRQGLYVIAQTGDHLALRNDVDFQAKIW